MFQGPACRKFRCYSIQKVSNKGTDQTTLMYRLVCTFDVRMEQSQVFLYQGPYGHRREKTCLRGFRQNETQTSLLSYIG